MEFTKGPITINRQTLILMVLMMIFAIKGVFYAIYIIPPTVAVSPDDIGHISYIYYIAAEHKLPILGDTKMEDTAMMLFNSRGNVEIEIDYTTIEVDENFSSENIGNGIAQHPPLYYLLITPFYMIARVFTNHFVPLLFTMRLATLLLGLISLYLTHKVLLQLQCNEKVAQCILLVFVFSPAIQFYFSSVTNDSLLILLCIAALYVLLKYFSEKRRGFYYVFVACCGGIIITKYTGGLVVLGYILYFVLRSFREEGWRKTFELLVKGGLLGCLIIGPVLGRNVFLLGSLFPVSYVPTKVFDYTVGQFLFESSYFTEIIANIIGLVGWLPMVASSDYIRYLAASICVLSSFFYVTNCWKQKYQWIAFLSAAIGTIIITQSLEYPLFVGLIIVSVFLIFLTLSIPVKNESLEQRDNNWFFLYLIVIVLVGFGIKHYEIYLHRGGPGATHGRYYYIALVPGLYVIFNSFKYLSQKFLKWIPALLGVLLFVGEYQMILKIIDIL